jgi:hypothetical protein
VHDKKSAGARPSHAFQESTTVDAVVVVVVTIFVNVVVNDMVRHVMISLFSSLNLPGDG